MPYVPPTAAASAPRTGGPGAWANPDAILASDDVRSAFVPIGPGDKSPTLEALAFTSNTPSGVATFRVERQSDPNDTGVSLVVSDLVQLYLSGSPIGPNLSHGEGLPDMDTVEEYPVDLASLGVTQADLAAGNLSLFLGWKSPVKLADSFDPSRWLIETIPNGTTTIDGGTPTAWTGVGPWGGSSSTSPANHSVISQGTATIRATWQGALSDCPPFLRLSVTTNLSAGTAPSYSAQGSTAATTTKEYYVTIDQTTGVGLLPIAMRAAGTSTVSQQDPF